MYGSQMNVRSPSFVDVDSLMMDAPLIEVHRIPREGWFASCPSSEVWVLAITPNTGTVTHCGCTSGTPLSDHVGCSH